MTITQCLSGSSDGTVRLWSLGQQRCVETFRIHEEGVWALAVDNEFTTFYSGGRDKKVYATEVFESKSKRFLLHTTSDPNTNHVGFTCFTCTESILIV